MRFGGLRARLLMGAAMGGALVLGYGRQSYAGGCAGGPNVFICAGPASGGDVTQVLAGAPLSVTTSPGFGIATAAGDAFTLTGTGGLAFTDLNGAAITGAANGIAASNDGGGDLHITTTGRVTGTAAAGISASNDGGGDLTIETAAVTGGTYGIAGFNDGGGDLTVTATGAVSGAGDFGVVTRDLGAGSLSVTVTSVTGGRAISAVNGGGGDLSVTATGTVTGTNAEGIYANDTGAGALSIDVAAVTGAKSGIAALNEGGGKLTIEAGGPVTGQGGAGISAVNLEGGGLEIAAAAVSGTTHGIVGRNFGVGDLRIEATGTVTGTLSDGVQAVNDGPGALTIITAAVSGGRYGIAAFNEAVGDLRVTATGAVTGGGDFGIVARDRGVGALSIAATHVTGGRAISAVNDGGGRLSVTTTGTVTGTDNEGIYARDTGGGDLYLRVATVQGATQGIAAINDGAGDLTVLASGLVSGTSASGLVAQDNTGGSVRIEVAAVTGGAAGIVAINEAEGNLTVTTSGAVTGLNGSGLRAVSGAYSGDIALTLGGATRGSTEGVYVNGGFASGGIGITLGSGAAAVGGSVGVFAQHLGTGAILLDNAGTIQQTSGDLALQAVDITSFNSPIVLENRAGGTIRGLVRLQTDSATINNAGLWANAGGTSSFGIAGGIVNQASGHILVGGGAAAELTTWSGLASFENAGLLDFRDGGVGDELGIASGYLGQEGRLALDAELGASGAPADFFSIGGSSGGTTLVAGKDAGGAGAATGTGPGQGIAVIEALGGSGAGDFALADGPVGAGGYAYDLVLESDGIWYLQSRERGQQLAVYANVATAAQNHAEAMLGPLAQRLGELRHLDAWAAAGQGQVAGLGATDLAAATAPPAAGHGVSVWGRGVGLEGEYSPGDAPGFEQRVLGFAAGADIGLGGLLAGDDRLYLGAQAGYGETRAEQDDGSEIELEGWSFALYASYLAADATPTPYDGLYLDALLHASLLDASVSTLAPASEADFDARVWGAALEAGWGFEVAPGLILEPQARLAFSRVSYDDGSDSVGAAFALEEGDSLDGRVGLRLQRHWDLHGVGHVAPYLEAHVAHEFAGGNEATVAGFAVSSDAGGTRYELGFGLDGRIGRDLALYGGVEVVWGEHVEQATQVTAGLRFSF